MTHVFDSNTCNPALDIVTIKNRFNELYTVLISIGRFTPFIKSDRIDFLTYFSVAGCPRRCLLTTKWFFAMRKKPKLGQHIGVRWILCPTPVILDGVIDFFYQRFILKLVDFGMTKDAMKNWIRNAKRLHLVLS